MPECRPFAQGRYWLLLGLGAAIALGAVFPIFAFFDLLHSHAVLTTRTIAVRLLLPHALFLLGLGLGLSGFILLVRQRYLAHRMAETSNGRP